MPITISRCELVHRNGMLILEPDVWDGNILVIPGNCIMDTFIHTQYKAARR